MFLVESFSHCVKGFLFAIRDVVQNQLYSNFDHATSEYMHYFRRCCTENTMLRVSKGNIIESIIHSVLRPLFSQRSIAALSYVVHLLGL